LATNLTDYPIGEERGVVNSIFQSKLNHNLSDIVTQRRFSSKKGVVLVLYIYTTVFLIVFEEAEKFFIFLIFVFAVLSAGL
jgi:hypothetical protein